MSSKYCDILKMWNIFIITLTSLYVDLYLQQLRKFSLIFVKYTHILKNILHCKIIGRDLIQAFIKIVTHVVELKTSIFCFYTSQNKKSSLRNVLLNKLQEVSVSKLIFDLWYLFTDLHLILREENAPKFFVVYYNIIVIRIRILKF